MQDNNRDVEATAMVAAVFKSINLISLGVATLISVGMIVDKHSVTTSVLAGVAFYGLVASLLILWQPGALPYVLVSRQVEVTNRRRDLLQFQAQMAQMPAPRAAIIDPMQLEYTPPAPAPTFVPVVPLIAPNLKVVAGSWVTQLFDTSTGRPLPNRITRTKSQVQQKSPEPQVVAYLESLGIVYQDEGKHLYWQVASYPTLRDALNAVRTGVGKPSSEEGKGG